MICRFYLAIDSFKTRVEEGMLWIMASMSGRNLMRNELAYFGYIIKNIHNVSFITFDCTDLPNGTTIDRTSYRDT